MHTNRVNLKSGGTDVVKCPCPFFTQKKKNDMKERVFEICDYLESKGMKVTADNVITESLFSKGGTVTDKRWAEHYVKQYLADKHPAQHLLTLHGQTLDDFKAFTSPIDGVVFMVCEKFMKQRHIDKMRDYLNELETKTVQQ